MLTPHADKCYKVLINSEVMHRQPSTDILLISTLRTVLSDLHTAKLMTGNI